MQSPPRPANGSNTPNAPSTAAAVSEQDITRRTTRVLRQLYHREKQWLAARTDDQAALLTQQGQLSLVEQLHYAEIAFVLLRLKPCAIIDYAGDRSQLADFISHVIEPAIRDLNVLGAAAKGLASADVLAAAAKSRTDSNTAWYPRPFHLTCVRISGQLASPEVASWAGAFVLFDEMWAESAAWVSTNLRDAAKTSISEDDLARGLDYPGSLPATAEEMQYIVPVSYLGRMK
ncbi:hypothetical protein GGI04_002395 [Coemansia thaxteri]|nr:hypothetical protein GGI04_002395 [Coemansia thaxteri]KAJ2469927.1 hypothetical protein GGI02_003284 [Coemansia sp. RSA 2322]